MDALDMMETWHEVCQYQDFWILDLGKPDFEKFVKTLEVLHDSNDQM